jgi:hypothetical protein
MTTKTRRELVEQALENLGALAAGQSADTEDVESVDNKVDPLLEEISTEGLLTVGDDEEIDSKIFLPLATLLAEKAAPAFGRPSDQPTIDAAKALIRRVTWAGPTFEYMKPDYF